jgi:hypothetical protein
MGRPIHKKYFGNKNTDGVGGEGVVASSGNVAVTFSNIGEGYFTANAGITFSAPQIAGGTTATGSVYLFANGAIKAVGLSSAGTGYTTKPTLAFTGANTTPAVGTITGGGLTATVENALNANARVTGGSVGKSADILSQRSSRRYKVRNADGPGVCALVPRLPTAVGEMALIATDSASGTYYVTKLTAHLATLTSIDGTEFTDGDNVRWTLGSAVLNTSVSIANN